MIKFLIKLYLISFVFQSTILFASDSIEVNLPTIIGAFITPFLLLSRSVYLSTSFRYIIVLTIWLLFRTYLEYGLDSYIFSLFQLLTAIIPSISVYKSFEKERFRNEVLNILKWQLVLFIPLILRDYGSFDLGILNDLFGEISHSTRSEYFGIKRSRASFYEPSYFGIYLCVVFFVFKSSKQSKLWLVLILLEVMSTFSFGSFILLIFVNAFGFVRKLSLTSLIKTSLVSSLIVFVILLTNPGRKVLSVVTERVQVSIEAVTSGLLTGSEGARINSLPVAIRFASESSKNFFFGEGYTYRNWLKNKFGSESLNQFGEGHIFNTFAAVIFHGGIVALAVYIVSLYAVFRTLKLSYTFIIIFLYIHFTYSGLQSYFLWMIIFFANLSTKIETEKRFSRIPNE